MLADGFFEWPKHTPFADDLAAGDESMDRGSLQAQTAKAGIPALGFKGVRVDHTEVIKRSDIFPDVFIQFAVDANIRPAYAPDAHAVAVRILSCAAPVEPVAIHVFL